MRMCESSSDLDLNQPARLLDFVCDAVRCFCCFSFCCRIRQSRIRAVLRCRGCLCDRWGQCRFVFRFGFFFCCSHLCFKLFLHVLSLCINNWRVFLHGLFDVLHIRWAEHFHTAFDDLADLCLHPCVSHHSVHAQLCVHDPH